MNAFFGFSVARRLLVKEAPERIGEGLCEFVEVDGMELLGFIAAAPAERRGLESQHVFRSDDSADYCTGGGALIRGKSKGAAGKIEERRAAFNEVRQYAAGIRIEFAGVAEKVVLLAVAVQVQTQFHLITPAVLRQPALKRDNVRVEYWGGRAPAAVQVHSRHVAAEVTVNHSVHVHHRDDLYYKVLQDVLDFWRVF